MILINLKNTLLIVRVSSEMGSKFILVETTRLTHPGWNLESLTWISVTLNSWSKAKSKFQQRISSADLLVQENLLLLENWRAKQKLYE